MSDEELQEAEETLRLWSDYFSEPHPSVALFRDMKTIIRLASYYKERLDEERRLGIWRALKRFFQRS